MSGRVHYYRGRLLVPDGSGIENIIIAIFDIALIKAFLRVNDATVSESRSRAGEAEH